MDGYRGLDPRFTFSTTMMYVWVMKTEVGVEGFWVKRVRRLHVGFAGYPLPRGLGVRLHFAVHSTVHQREEGWLTTKAWIDVHHTCLPFLQTTCEGHA